jgi:hypothetical protein
MNAGAFRPFHFCKNRLAIGENFVAGNSVTGKKLFRVFLGG